MQEFPLFYTNIIMDKRARLILATVLIFFITAGFTLWVLLEVPTTPEPVTPEPVTSVPSGPCSGSVYGMIYQYNSAGKCMPVRCENGYQKIAGQCILDGSDTRNVVYNNTTANYGAARVGFRLGKIRL
jgi:hypothetical protein